MTESASSCDWLSQGNIRWPYRPLSQLERGRESGWVVCRDAPGLTLSFLNPSPGPAEAAAMKERRAPQPVVARCKLVLVGDVQCGKTAMLQVLAKDCYPEVSCSPARWPPFLFDRLLLRVDSHLPRGAVSSHPTLPHPQQLSGWRTALPWLPLRPVPLLPPSWLLLTSSPIGP